MPSEQYREPLSRGLVREGNDNFPDMATSHEMVKCLPCPSKGKHTVDHRPRPDAVHARARSFTIGLSPTGGVT